MLTTSKILLTLAVLLLGGGAAYASHGHSGGHGFKPPSFSCKAR